MGVSSAEPSMGLQGRCAAPCSVWMLWTRDDTSDDVT